MPKISFRKLFAPVIRKILVREAERIAKSARNNAIFSARLQKAIVVGTVDETENKFSIDVKVDPTIVPIGMASAFEFGSGIHDEETPATYPIYPKNADALAFYWPGGPSAQDLWGSKKFIGTVPGDGRLMFTHVDHPGVEGIHYMQRAVDENKKTLLGRIADVTVTTIADSLGPRIEIIR